ncbi:MAG TPA: PAS domain-containing sensor histidine kinase [Burkholderiales bacterium]|nr:PAS domain-containing sensor histidine kinase [Burkholderiales bacterium]
MELDTRPLEPILGGEPADEQFRLLISSVVDYAMFLLDPTGRIVSWNPGAQRIKGYQEAEVIGRHFSMFYSLGDRALGVPASLLARAEREGHAEHEGWRVRKDGSRFWADVVITALRGQSGFLRGFAKVTRDMTERRQAEESLREQRTLLTKAAGDLLGLTRRLVEAEEAERRRLARELHDDVGQNLSALSLNLDVARASLGDAAPDVRARLDDSLALVENTLGAIESVMADLRPPLLEEYGLGAALERHVEEFARRTGIDVLFEDEAKERARSLKLETAVALFRIAQEALNNVAKHSKAKQVRVSLFLQDLDAVLSVIDDGCGFDAVAAAAARPQRWGMRTMRERAEAAGGRIDVFSAPKKGTSIVASVRIS